MDIKTEKDVTGPAAKHLRELHSLSQKAFWVPLGITQSGGSRYEGKDKLPRIVRIMIYAMYVAGIKIDASTPEGAAELCKLGSAQAASLRPNVTKMGEKLVEAKSHINKAAGALAEIS